MEHEKDWLDTLGTIARNLERIGDKLDAMTDVMEQNHKELMKALDNVPVEIISN